MKVLNAKVVGMKKEGAMYCGRPSVFGNPFVIGKDGSREEVIRKYEVYLKKNPQLIARAKKELRGKDLICWCAPLACHCDVLLKIANSD